MRNNNSREHGFSAQLAAKPKNTLDEISAHLGSHSSWRAEQKFSPLDYLLEWLAPCPWSTTAGLTGLFPAHERRPLYTTEERHRRDSSPWTRVQGALAPVQFAIFLVSLGLVLNYLLTGNGYAVATVSVVVKTGILYLIMVTGAIWEKQIFGKYLFADSFFWEDTVSMLVLALHTAYLFELMTGIGSAHQLMGLALAAYASYAINATQFILKLRTARLEAPVARPTKNLMVGAK